MLAQWQKAFGDETMSQKNIDKWYRDFKEDKEGVDDLQRSGRPSTSIDDHNINKIKEMVRGNRRIAMEELVDMVGISFGVKVNSVKLRFVAKFLNFF